MPLTKNNWYYLKCSVFLPWFFITGPNITAFISFLSWSYNPQKNMGPLFLSFMSNYTNRYEVEKWDMYIKQHRNGQAAKLHILLMLKVTVPSVGNRTILHKVKTVESYWVHGNDSSLWKPGLASRAMEQNWKKYHIHFYIHLGTYFHSPSGMLNLGWSKAVNFMFLHSKSAILIYGKKSVFYTIQ